MADGAAAARRPGLRRRAHPADPAADRGADRPESGLAGGRDRQLRRVLRALPGHLVGPGDPVDVLHRPHRDDLRRPRRARRLEHQRHLASSGRGAALVVRPDPGRARRVLGAPAPGQPVPRRAGGRHLLAAGHGGRRRRVGPARRHGRPRRRRDRHRDERAQGGPVQLLLGARPQPARRRRLPQRADRRVHAAQDGLRRGVRLDLRSAARARRHRPRDDRDVGAVAAPAGHLGPAGRHREGGTARRADRPGRRVRAPGGGSRALARVRALVRPARRPAPARRPGRRTGGRSR